PFHGPFRRSAGRSCARAASGHSTAVPPMSVMKSRRLMPDIGVPPASALPVHRTLNLLKKGRKVLGPDLKCSESDRVEPYASPTRGYHARREERAFRTTCLSEPASRLMARRLESSTLH